MTTSARTNHRSLAVLLLPEPVPALLTRATGIVSAMTGNAHFPSPVPPLPLLEAAIGGLHDAQIDAEARLRGAVLLRDEKKVALVALLQQLRGYVQAASDADIENGASIIASAGIGVKKQLTLRPRVFAARAGRVSGAAELVAPVAARRASYEWCSSTDGGRTWVALPSTLQSRTTVTGLPTGTALAFRYRSVTKTGQGDWSGAASLTLLP